MQYVLKTYPIFINFNCINAVALIHLPSSIFNLLSLTEQIRFDDLTNQSQHQAGDSSTVSVKHCTAAPNVYVEQLHSTSFFVLWLKTDFQFGLNTD